MRGALAIGALNERLQKMQMQKVWTLDEVKADWARVKCEVAWVRMQFAARDYRLATERKHVANRRQAAWLMARKYSPDQPRVPGGQSGGGQWTDGGGGGAQASQEIINRIVEPLLHLLMHANHAGPNQICPAKLNCNAAEIAYYLSRASVPGQDPSLPVENGERYFVFDPRNGLPAGYVRSRVSPDGLTIVNRTLPGHIFHDGKIIRHATHNRDGSWSVITFGAGTNTSPILNLLNQFQGPKIFDYLDQQLSQRILRYRGSTKTAGLDTDAREFGQSGCGRSSSPLGVERAHD
jgi:hypothetical protein